MAGLASIPDYTLRMLVRDACSELTMLEEHANGIRARLRYDMISEVLANKLLMEVGARRDIVRNQLASYIELEKK